MKDMVMGWAQWLSGTALSNWLAIHEWIVPTSQSFHILSVGVVFTCALLISFRLLGIGRSSRTVSQLVTALVPWMYGGLVVLLMTGSIQIMAEPAREFVGDVFWWKMAMIVLVVPLTIWFARTVRSNAARWDAPETRPFSGRMFGIVSLILWVGIIFCGRFIAYTFGMYVQGVS